MDFVSKQELNYDRKSMLGSACEEEADPFIAELTEAVRPQRLTVI